jgi:hypothetical protein
MSEEIVARAMYAANGWWRSPRENDDGKGRYHHGLRAVEWEELDADERGGRIRDAAVALAASRPLILEEAAKVADEFSESHRNPPHHNDTFWTATNLAKAIRCLASKETK